MRVFFYYVPNAIRRKIALRLIRCGWAVQSFFHFSITPLLYYSTTPWPLFPGKKSCLASSTGTGLLILNIKRGGSWGMKKVSFLFYFFSSLFTSL